MAIDVERIKRRHAIAEVVAAHGVPLRPVGSRLVARCPFHEDGRASMVVYPATSSYYCFGCGAGGDVIDFVRRVERVGFREAVALLGAERPEPIDRPVMPRPPLRLSLDDRLMLTAACELYHETLLRTPGMLRYVETRGVAPWLTRYCRLGYSDGTSLAPYLKRRRLSLKRAQELGLLFPSGDETMAGRVVIPDLRGAHCGWMVGRIVDGLRSPKYRGLALPRPLLGFERARGHQRVFLTEGPFDWLTLVGWGLPACALLGTQPGADTLRLLARARSVVLVLDTDDSGRAAAIALAASIGDRARVVELPEGVKDVNELGVQPDGREAFFRAVDEAERRARDVASAG
ncbi:MAG: hypothetical protein C4558_08920 [Dehalococcoidia bacterium]|nr:MAG: hypothetical protein C4558_08920 [Dehalococcoidia bacterium]